MRFLAERRGGLECGASGGKLVLLSRRRARVRIEKVGIEEDVFASRIKGSSNPPVEVVRKLLIKHNLSRYKIAVFPAKVADSCFVILPGMGKADLDGARLLQAKKILLWHEPEPVVTYTDFRLPRDHIGSVVSLADWNSVKTWCSLVEGCGGEIDNVTVPACAYKALADRQGWAKQYPVFFVADFGAASSSFYAFDAHAVRFVRKVLIGGDSITKALTTQVSVGNGFIRLNEVEAEGLKIKGMLSKTSAKTVDLSVVQPQESTSGQGEESGTKDSATKTTHQIDMMIRPIVEKISAELLRSIQFFQENSGRRVEAVFITGGSTGLQTLKKHLKTSLRIPVKVIDPFAGCEFASPDVKNMAEKHHSRLAVAAGLALARQREMSLLPGNIRVLRRIGDFTSAVAAVLLLAVFSPLLAKATLDQISIRRAKIEIDQESRKTEKFQQQQADLTMLQAETQKMTDFCRRTKKIVSRKPRWAGILNALAEAIPEHVILIHLITGSSKPESLNIIVKGKVLPSAASFEGAVASVLSSLSSSPFFSQVKVTSAEANREKDLPGVFEIRFEIVY